MPISVRVPGSTSNLVHGFDCMGMAVGLANVITVDVRDDDAIACPTAADAGLQHMAERVRGACAAAWGPLPGLTVSISGSVPISRGLGSSSTIYLGLGAACQVLAGRAVDRDELIRLGVGWEGHPDNITASALGGFTLAGRDHAGELVWQRYPVPDGLEAVIAIPSHEVRTSDARGALPAELPAAEAVTGWQRSALITGALATGRVALLRGLLEDGWHERYRVPLNPGFLDARRAADEAGALGTIISGSGSTVLSLVTAEHREAVVGALQAAYPDEATVVQAIAFDNDGLTVTECS